jgi:hypothetical protein
MNLFFFSNKAGKVMATAAECYKNNDYQGFIYNTMLAGYCNMFNLALAGEINTPTVDCLCNYFCIDEIGKKRPTLAVKKINPNFSITDINTESNVFVQSIADDVILLNNTAIQVVGDYWKLPTLERIKVKESLCGEKNTIGDIEQALLGKNDVCVSLFEKYKGGKALSTWFKNKVEPILLPG